jgi:hypothetical protein
MHFQDDASGPALLSLGITSVRDPGNNNSLTLARAAVHYMRRPVKRGLLFGYGAIEENDIGEGLTRLRRALRLLNARR